MSVPSLGEGSLQGGVRMPSHYEIDIAVQFGGKPNIVPESEVGEEGNYFGPHSSQCAGFARDSLCSGSVTVSRSRWSFPPLRAHSVTLISKWSPQSTVMQVREAI